MSGGDNQLHYLKIELRALVYVVHRCSINILSAINLTQSKPSMLLRLELTAFSSPTGMAKWKCVERTRHNQAIKASKITIIAFSSPTDLAKWKSGEGFDTIKTINAIKIIFTAFSSPTDLAK